MKKTFVIFATLLMATSTALAQESHDHDHKHGAHHEDGQQHDHAADDQEPHPDGTQNKNSVSRGDFPNKEIADAVDAGGDLIVANVRGVVCDFCATAMNKIFSKREEVAATYVDLDAKTLSIVTKPDNNIDDATIEKLISKAGYKTASITRVDLSNSAENDDADET